MHCARLNRRDLGMLLCGAITAWARPASGQQPLPVIGFLHQGNPARSAPGRCLDCGDREYGYDPLLPYGVESTGHAWLHSRCWEAWHAARKREAAAALKAMGVGKPTCNEMKDGPGHGEGGPKKICDQPPNAYGP
jgi:hypothetical protein